MKISKLLVSVLMMMFIAVPVISAQENPDTSYWKFGGMGNLSLSQVSLTNWAAGGENSFSSNILANGSAKYNKGKSSWETKDAISILDIDGGMLLIGRVF